MTIQVRWHSQETASIVRRLLSLRGAVTTVCCLAQLIFAHEVHGFLTTSSRSPTYDRDILPWKNNQESQRCRFLERHLHCYVKSKRSSTYHSRTVSSQPVLFSSKLNDEENGNELDTPAPLFAPSNATSGDNNIAILDIKLSEHKPLGCTVEESLAPYNLAEQITDSGEIEKEATFPVFIQKVVEGGIGDRFGLKVGDVIIGVTGVFDELQDVSYAGLDKVKSLVAGREADAELVIRVMRGTDVKEKHEEALVDLCTLDGNDADMNACLDSIFSYGDEIDNIKNNDKEDMEDIGNSDDVILESMYQIWGDELGPNQKQADANDDKPEPVDSPPKKDPAPWSSRSSPSGTFVRNPKTGKLEDISNM